MIKDFELVDAELSRIITQYRESPKLLHVIRTYLRLLEEAAQQAQSVSLAFDIDTSVGEQLTYGGKQMGFIRCHCVCTTQPVFGFECEGYSSPYTIAGFCEPNSTWVHCAPQGVSEICINDDELYRKFLKVRAFQNDERVDLPALEASVRIFWGDKAKVMSTSNRQVVVAPGRELTPTERSVLQLYPRVMPISVGVAVRFHLDPNTRVFGFGEGWAGFCDTSIEPTQLVTDGGDDILTDDGSNIDLGPLFRDANWMCREDVRPYDCF